MALTVTSVVHALAVPAVLIAEDGYVSAANESAEILLGSGCSGRAFEAVLRQPALVEAVQQTRRDGQDRSAPFQHRAEARDTLYDVKIRAAGTPEPGQSGAVLISFSDVSHVEQASRMRRDFVANVSHELRTPLTSLMGFIETLQGPAKDDPTAQARFLQIMAAEALRMDRLVQDLLSLSRVEGEGLALPDTQLEPVLVIKSVASALGPRFDQTGAVLELDLDAAAGLTLRGDRDQLTQLFSNLIENALKYGAQGGTVRVVANTDAKLRGRPALELSVHDEGQGIDAVHIPRLSERFYRVDSHRAREVGGTGLGLAIVKAIAQRHKGRLKITSKLGKGSTFSVLLPVSQPSS